MNDSPRKEQRSPSRGPSRAQSAMQRSQQDGNDDSRPDSSWRPRSRLGKQRVFIFSWQISIKFILNRE